MLLILVEVQTAGTEMTMHLEVSVKVACQSMTPQSYLHATYSGGSICESGLSVHDSHRLKAQSYHHATYSGGSTDCRHRAITMEVSVKVACQSMMPQSYLHATYSGGSICVSGLSVHYSHRLQPQS